MEIEKNLLVPTDFSENANSALQFAKILAKDSSFNIHLLHVIEQAISEEEKDEIKKNSLALEMEIQKDFPDNSVKVFIEEGKFIQTLLNQLDKVPYENIVMGTNGVSGLKQRWLGSNTFQTIDKSPVHVWAIPLEIKNTKPRNLGFLTNYKEVEIELFKKFTQQYGEPSQLKLLHIREIHEDPNFQKDAWIGKFAQFLPKENISLHEDTTSNRLDIQDSLSDCVQDFIINLDLEALLIQYKPHSFFKNIFGKNVGRNLSQDLKVPICYFK